MITFSKQGWEDYCSWSGNRKMATRVNRLIDEAHRDPAIGAGKPERLKGDIFGYWSRRIDQERRLVYTVDGDQLIIVQARHHY